MTHYRFGDQILEAFYIFKRPLSLQEIVEYVSEICNIPEEKLRLPVETTLTAAVVHGFLRRSDEDYVLELPEHASGD